MTNTELITALQVGDETAFEQIYKQYHQAVFSNICKLLGNYQGAEDVLQEVFIALWHNKNKLTVAHSVAGWLFTTSYLKSLEHLKKIVKLSINQLTDAHTQLHFEVNEHHNFEIDYSKKVFILSNAIELLPRQKKLAFKLCRIEGKTYEEIASILNVSVDTAREYVKSASKLLRQTVTSNQLATTTLGFIALSLFLEN